MPETEPPEDDEARPYRPEEFRRLQPKLEAPGAHRLPSLVAAAVVLVLVLLVGGVRALLGG